ncbi:MAG TPA: 2-amino-4-hydroxy-6-hydroxymethyldihydropteridine diphosphokinase [Planctomycetaceae bacterium]|jgi:2-amino-4-hydroxy-6-hydroxymethyldihydropteridine diphosphokinase|nr:2-amino-4-hydroxy-6-hydroxymethyldihydropteridine diphosphokinase [Planctomycetaceae bacterium]
MSDRSTNRAYLSLGSNIEPEQNLPAAVRALTSFGRIVAVSNVWESAPFGSHGANFLNAAVLLETELSATEIYQQAIVEVERQLGRVRDPHDKNAPRTIDVDLSLFNHDVFEWAGHRVPDPEILKRHFVAVPLAELDPDYVHPTEGRRLADIAASWRSSPGLVGRPDVRLR